MKWLAINAWLFAKDPLSVLQITLKSQRIALLIKYIHISVRDILLVLLSYLSLKHGRNLVAEFSQ